MDESAPNKRPNPALEIAFDVTVAVAAGIVSGSVFLSLQQQGPFGEMGPANIWSIALLLAIHSGCLVARRIRPLETLLINIASGIGVLALGWPAVTLGIAVVVAVYSAGAGLPRRASLFGLAVAEAGVIGSAVLELTPMDLSTYFGNAVVLAVAWFIGNTIRSRREYSDSLERRNRELEAARDELAQRAVAEERVRIARELHDLIAHSMSVIAVQSGAGAHVIDDDHAAAKTALQVIERTSRSTLLELRRVLGLLREDDSPGSFDPAPSLDAIDSLIERVRESSGLDIELQTFGERSELSPGTQLAIYRIAQEALTNVIKHANARRGRVVISYEPDLVRVEIVDDGIARGEVTQGNGLRGMRERVELYGGRLEAGPLPEGGFRVAAQLPTGGVT